MNSVSLPHTREIEQKEAQDEEEVMLAAVKANDYLMWVGGRYYTIESFIEEAKRMGVARRVPFIPDFRPGKTRIFLVHDITEKDQNLTIKKVNQKKVDRKKHRTFRIKKPQGYSPTPYIFGYFIPVGILIPSVKGREIVEAVRKRFNIVEIPFNRIQNYQRGCGTLKADALYLVDSEGLEFVLELADIKEVEIMTAGRFVEINPWIPAPGLKRFRGLKIIDGDALLREHKLVSPE